MSHEIFDLTQSIEYARKKNKINDLKYNKFRGAASPQNTEITC